MPAEEPNQGNSLLIVAYFDPFNKSPITYSAFLFSRYKLCVIGINGSTYAKFMLFRDDNQHVVGKQVGVVLRSSRGGDAIPTDIVRIVCKKYNWHVSITDKSFQGPRKSYQVNRIVVAVGKHVVVLQIYPSFSTDPSSSRLATLVLQIAASKHILQTPLTIAAHAHHNTVLTLKVFANQIFYSIAL